MSRLSVSFYVHCYSLTISVILHWSYALHGFHQSFWSCQLWLQYIQIMITIVSNIADCIYIFCQKLFFKSIYPLMWFVLLFCTNFKVLQLHVKHQCFVNGLIIMMDCRIFVLIRCAKFNVTLNKSFKTTILASNSTIWFTAVINKRYNLTYFLQSILCR